MKEITGVSGACADQARISIRLDLKGKLKEEIEDLINEGFSLLIDLKGFLTGESRGTFEEILRIKQLLEARGFRDEWGPEIFF